MQKLLNMQTGQGRVAGLWGDKLIQVQLSCGVLHMWVLHQIVWDLTVWEI